jgi:hypothetical protein
MSGRTVFRFMPLPRHGSAAQLNDTGDTRYDNTGQRNDHQDARQQSGLYVVEGRQRTFTLAGTRKSPVAAMANVAVDIET